MANVNGKKLVGEAFLAEVLTFAPKDFNRLPGGALEEHEVAIAELAKRGLVKMSSTTGRSPAGPFNVTLWRRAASQNVP